MKNHVAFSPKKLSAEANGIQLQVLGYDIEEPCFDNYVINVLGPRPPNFLVGKETCKNTTGRLDAHVFRTNGRRLMTSELA